MNRKRSISLFWEFILVYTLLVLLTSVLLGSVLTGVYLRNVNLRSQNMIQSQATHAVADLKAQLDAMRMLSLKMSVQRTYSLNYFSKSKSHEIELLDSLQRYQSYLSLTDEFALMYRNGQNQETYVFKSDGSKTELDVYLKRYGLVLDAAMEDFLFVQDARARVMNFASGLVIAYPVRPSAYSNAENTGTLCFMLSPTAFEERIGFTSDIQPGSYTLKYQGTTLIERSANGPCIASGDADGFYIEACVPKAGLNNLLSQGRDLALFIVCIGVLLVCIIILAWRCYRPARSLVRKYTGDERKGASTNEWAALDQAMEQMQTRSQILDRQAVSRTALLRNYALLMLFNNVSIAGHLSDFQKIGLNFDKPLFGVVAIRPRTRQAVSSDSMDVLAASMDDLAEDAGALYAIECDPESHTLAVLCNVAAPEQMDTLLSRLRTYLSCQSIPFLMGTGRLMESMAGIPASYLAALSHLEENACETDGENAPINSDRSETAVLLRQMLDKVELSDCQGALLDLETYMAHQGPQVSELMRRYNLFNVKCAIQQLCEKMGYQLSSEQMSMLLTMNDYQSVHYTLLQMIPVLCAHAQSRSRHAVLSASNLVMEYLHSHFCDYDISAQCIAEAVGIGVNRTNAIIKESTGMSCKTYLTQLRLEQAKKLLMETDISVTDICGQVGYNSASHFIKVFRTAVGQTPDAFRRSQKDT